MSSRTATLIGLTTILMWSLLSVMTVATGKIPAFQLAAMTFAIGGAVGLSTWIGRPGAIRALKQPPAAWLVGVGGLFGYHALYFLALRFAPPAEAGLLNYLWPLLIVLFSSLLPGERLAIHHVIGAVLGLAGTVLLFAGSAGGSAPGQVPGLVAAFLAQAGSARSAPAQSSGSRRFFKGRSGGKAADGRGRRGDGDVGRRVGLGKRRLRNAADGEDRSYASGEALCVGGGG